MANTLFLAPTANFLSKTLSGAITDSAQTITLNNTTNMQAPGYIVVDRTDSNGTPTPNAREVISYTGISGNDLTGCTRGADNSTARQHSDGAIAETSPTVGMFNSLATIVASGFTKDGYLKAINSPVSINAGKFITLTSESVASVSILHTPLARISGALISVATISGHLNLSTASVTGISLSPAFIGSGDYSGPTIAIGGILTAPRPTTLSWVSAFTRYVVSTASIAFNFKVRNTSVFADATVCMQIAAGGTFVSTASILNKNVNAGDLIQADLLRVDANGFVRQITIQAG